MAQVLPSYVRFLKSSTKVCYIFLEGPTYTRVYTVPSFEYGKFNENVKKLRLAVSNIFMKGTIPELNPDCCAHSDEELAVAVVDEVDVG